MAHPSFQDILALAGADPNAVDREVEDHVRSCDLCSALAATVRGDVGFARATSPKDLVGGDLSRMVVSREIYADWTEIGIGGMGRTFRATDRRLGRTAAVKELRPADHFRDPGLRARLRARFQREASLAARLQHPAIVPVFEAGQWEDGEPFYAMQYVEGTRLDEEIAARDTLHERLALLPAFITISEAVAYAHSRGIVHRDVNPRNILVGVFGESYLIDWGLASDLEAEPEGGPAEAHGGDGLTIMGAGTPPYMAPEQAGGAAAEQSMDIYALGATLYHLLAGEPPYGTGDPSVLRRRLEAGPPAPLAEVATGVPAPLQTLVERAMARSPAERFPSAQDLASELRRFHTGQLTRTHRHSPGDIVRDFLRRHRASVRIALLALLALAVIGVVGLRRIIRERDVAEQERTRAEDNERRARHAAAEAQATLAGRLAADPDRRLDALVLAIEAVGPALQRGAKLRPAMVAGLFDTIGAGRAHRVVLRARGPVGGGRFSSDGTLFGAALQPPEPAAVHLWRTEDAEEVAVLAPAGFVAGDLDFSPDASRAVIWGRGGAEIWRLAPARRTAALPHDGSVTFAGFSPDGTRVLTTSYDGTARIWSSVTGRRDRTVPIGSPLVLGRWLGDEAVFLAADDGGAWILELDRDRLTAVTQHVAEVGGADATPDLRSILSVDRAGRLLRTSIGNPSQPTVVRPGGVSNRFVGRIALASESLAALAVDDDQTLLVDLEGRRPDLPIHAIAGFAGDLTGAWAPFSPDNQRIALTLSGRGDIRVHDTRTGDLLLELVGHDITPWRTEFSPDGERLLSVSWDGTVRLWDVRAGLAIQDIQAHASAITRLAIAPGGERFATAGLDGTIILWNARSLRVERRVAAGSEVLALAWADHGTRLAAGDADGAVHVIPTAGDVLRFSAHEGAVRAIAFTPDGAALATGGLDGTVRTWDIATGAAALALKAPDAVTALAVSPDGVHVAASSADGSVRVWLAEDGTPGATIRAPTSAGATALCFAPDGATLAVGSVADRTEIHSIAGDAPVIVLDGHVADAEGCPYSPDGTRLVTVTADGRILVWSARGAPIQELSGHQRSATSAAFSMDSQHVVSSALDGAVRVWEPVSGSSHVVWQGGPTPSVSTFLPSGWLIIATDDGRVLVRPATVDDAWREACAMLRVLERRHAAAGQCP